MTTWTPTGGSPDSTLEKFTGEDILASEGGQLRKRGKVVHATDFSDGYNGWMPVYNAAGAEGAHGPHSLVDYPASALRIAAPGPWAGQAIDASSLVRLARPRDTDDMAISLSFRYAIFNELLPSASGSAATAKQMRQFAFGFDTQGWGNDERQFFQVFAENTADVSSDKYYLRVERNTSGSQQKATVPTSSALGLMIGANENKTNMGYARLTVRPGHNPDYLEMQLGGKVVDLRGICAGEGYEISEPLQLNSGDYSANFRGGMNPFLGVAALGTATDAAHVGVFITDVCVTYGDVLA